MEKSPSSLYTVRFNDCDPLGHLNNSRYLDYGLNAREDHLREFYQVDLAGFYEQGLAWVVSSHEIAYLRPAKYNERIVIQTALLLATEDLLHLEVLLFNETRNQLKAIMRTKLVPVNPQTARKTQHPAEFMIWAKSVENTDNGQYESLTERTKSLKKAEQRGTG